MARSSSSRRLSSPRQKPTTSRRGWLTGLGYKFILFPDVVFAAHRALTSFAKQLAETDSLDVLAEQMTGFDEFNDFVELRHWRQLESRYVDESRRQAATTQEVP